MDIVGAANATPIRRMDFIKGKHKPNSPEGIDFLKIIQESNPPVYEAIRGLNPRRIQVDTENKWALVLQDNPAVQRFIEGENDPTWYVFDFSPEGPHQPIYQNTTRQQCKDWLTQQLSLV